MIQFLSKDENTEEAAASFTQITLNQKYWLLVSPMGDMWSAPTTAELFDRINKERNEHTNDQQL
jgi:hypothetical protein